MDATVHDTVKDRLRRGRQRYTEGRRALVEVLIAAGRPLTIADIIAAGGELAQSSVYRNLQVLEQVGVVRRVVTPSEGGARFELAEDLTHHHHHLICTVCGSVEDFLPSSPLETVLQRMTREVSEDGGFTPEHHRLDLVGTCGSCT